LDSSHKYKVNFNKGLYFKGLGISTAQILLFYLADFKKEKKDA